MICRNQQRSLHHRLRDVIVPCQSVLRAVKREMQRRRGRAGTEVQRRRDGTPVPIDISSAVSSPISGTTPSDAKKTVEHNPWPVQTMSPLGLPRASTAIYAHYFSTVGPLLQSGLVSFKRGADGPAKKSNLPCKDHGVHFTSLPLQPQIQYVESRLLQRVHHFSYTRGRCHQYTRCFLLRVILARERELSSK